MYVLEIKKIEMHTFVKKFMSIFHYYNLRNYYNEKINV